MLTINPSAPPEPRTYRIQEIPNGSWFCHKDGINIPPTGIFYKGNKGEFYFLTTCYVDKVSDCIFTVEKEFVLLEDEISIIAKGPKL